MTETLSFRGIEVTADNYSFALTHVAEEQGTYSDLYTQIQATFDHGGFKRAADYLLRVPAELRQEIVWEAHRHSNMTGMRYADAVSIEVQRKGF